MFDESNRQRRLDPLEQAIVDLLMSLGPRFEDYLPGEWSDAEQKAIARMLRAGLIQVEYVIVLTEDGTNRRERVIGRLEGGIPKSEQMIGEVLFAIGWYPRGAKLTRGVHMDSQISRLRLTEQGQVAAEDVRGGDMFALEWVMRPHPNSPRLFVMRDNEGTHPVEVAGRGPSAVAVSHA